MMFTYASLLVTMSRNTITFLRETFLHRFIPFDSAIAFHKYIAMVALFFTGKYCYRRSDSLTCCCVFVSIPLTCRTYCLQELSHQALLSARTQRFHKCVSPIASLCSHITHFGHNSHLKHVTILTDYTCCSGQLFVLPCRFQSCIVSAMVSTSITSPLRGPPILTVCSGTSSGRKQLPGVNLIAVCYIHVKLNGQKSRLLVQQ